MAIKVVCGLFGLFGCGIVIAWLVSFVVFVVLVLFYFCWYLLYTFVSVFG